MAWRMTNETVEIGEIFQKGFCDECGYDAEFFKVVGKRGKTLVIVKLVDSEPTGKEVKNGSANGEEIRAVPSKEIGEEIKVRAYITEEGKTVLYDINATDWYSLYTRGDTSERTGYYNRSDS